MKVLKTDGNLTNFEVYHHIIQEKKNRENTPFKNKDIGFIEKTVHEYLKNHTSCDLISQESIQNFLELSQHFDLTPQERLQIVNLCPTTLVEIYLIVENCESRLGQEKAEELLYLAKETLLVNSISNSTINSAQS